MVGQESGIARPYDAHKKGDTEEADDVVARYLPSLPRVQTHLAAERHTNLNANASRFQVPSLRVST